MHELWKGKGLTRVCASYRGICLNDVLGKIYHSLLRQRLQPLLEKFAPSSQCGAVSGRGTVVAILNLRSLLQLLTARTTSTCCFFLDIRAAFDSVCHEFVATFLKYGPEVAANAAGPGHEECDLLRRRILEDGSALELAGASEHLSVLVADALHNTWFSTVGVEGDIVRTNCGTILGDPLGDILFAFLGARVKHAILLRCLPLGWS